MNSVDLNAWRTSRTATLNLPCGLSVDVKKVTLLDLAAIGSIPTPLIGEVESILTDGLRFSVVELEDNFKVINHVVKCAVISPHITDEPTEDSVGINEIPANDRLEIYMWAKEEASKLAMFPVK